MFKKFNFYIFEIYKPVYIKYSEQHHKWDNASSVKKGEKYILNTIFIIFKVAGVARASKLNKYIYKKSSFNVKVCMRVSDLTTNYDPIQNLRSLLKYCNKFNGFILKYI